MSVFRTVEVSNPRFEKDHLRFITIKSRALKSRGDICVFVPPDIDELEHLPVVILLHGVYGSSWSWAYCSGVHLQAMSMIEKKMLPKMIIAMPSDGLWGDGSAYLPHRDKDYEQWISGDVTEILKEVFPQVSGQSPFFISGLSMGGFGALRLGIKYPSLFKAVSAHSAITAFEQMKLFVEEDLVLYGQLHQAGESILELALKNKYDIPPIRFDCGTEDLLISHNRELHRLFTEHDIRHDYQEFEGGHEWSYWERHISKSLLFFAHHLNS